MQNLGDSNAALLAKGYNSVKSETWTPPADGVGSPYLHYVGDILHVPPWAFGDLTLEFGVLKSARNTQITLIYSLD